MSCEQQIVDPSIRLLYLFDSLRSDPRGDFDLTTDFPK
jgi:hypothetical protein